MELSREKLKQIPSLVMLYISEICRENRIKPRITNFKVETEQAKRSKEQRGEDYYDGAPIKDVLRFASVGTKIAFEVLDHLEINEENWKSDVIFIDVERAVCKADADSKEVWNTKTQIL